ncbi:MAG: MarR family transcriptional regulator, partial [Clostridia bacterium]|nr:MarR family transcriptional regulator [Clostridia bacterium]
ADKFFEEISWKQCFLIICIRLFNHPPAIKDISELVGSSHQNVKQLLLKLEKNGFVKIVPDEEDLRKQRVILTDKAIEFSEKNDKPSQAAIDVLFAGIDQEALKTTVQTIMQLDENLKKIKPEEVQAERRKLL